MSTFDFSAIFTAWPFLLEGLWLSFLLTIAGLAGGICLGLVIAIARLSRWRLARLAAAFYTNGFRAIPLILVIFWFYFLVPLILGHSVGALQSVLIAFVMFEAAYYSEILRAGITSVRRGQWHAAFSSGMTYFQALRFVILPQAFKIMMPLIVTQGVVLFQDTSLVYVVSLRDFMTASSIVANNQNRLVEMYLFAAAVYFVLCGAGSSLAKRLRARRSEY